MVVVVVRAMEGDKTKECQQEVLIRLGEFQVCMRILANRVPGKALAVHLHSGNDDDNDNDDDDDDDGDDTDAAVVGWIVGGFSLVGRFACLPGAGW